MSIYAGHIATYWSTVPEEEGLIISSFNAWATMKSATQRFNHYAVKQGKPGMKITPQVYHKKGTIRTSNRAFKLMNVPRSVKTKDIEQALARVLHHNSCTIGLPDENHDISVSVHHDRAVNILNDTWCIDVGKHLVQLAPAHFQKSHLEQRNNYIGKFLGFHKDKPLGVMLDILTVHDARFVFQKASDPNVYVKFANKSDLEAACQGTFHFEDMSIYGLPQNIPWSDKKVWRTSSSACSDSPPNGTSLNQERPMLTGSNRTPLSKLARSALSDRSGNSRSRASKALNLTQQYQTVKDGVSLQLC